MRAAARGMRLRAHQAVEQCTPPPDYVGEAELRSAISVIVRRSYQDSPKSEWKAIAAKIGAILRVDPRHAYDVLEKLKQGKITPEERRPGTGRKPRFVNQLGVRSPCPPRPKSMSAGTYLSPGCRPTVA